MPATTDPSSADGEHMIGRIRGLSWADAGSGVEGHVTTDPVAGALRSAFGGGGEVEEPGGFCQVEGG
jgi:hypothetical protein